MIFGYIKSFTSTSIIATSILSGGSCRTGALISAAGVSRLVVVDGPLEGTLEDQIGPKIFSLEQET